MSVPTNIRIQTVLIMSKFESSGVVRRKLEVELGRSTSIDGAIRATFQRFCETGAVEEKEYSGRPSKMIEEVRDVIENQSQLNVRTVTITYFNSPAIMTQHLSLKLYKMNFVQQLID